MNSYRRSDPPFLRHPLRRIGNDVVKPHIAVPMAAEVDVVYYIEQLFMVRTMPEFEKLDQHFKDIWETDACILVGFVDKLASLINTDNGRKIVDAGVAVLRDLIKPNKDRSDEEVHRSMEDAFFDVSNYIRQYAN